MMAFHLHISFKISVVFHIHRTSTGFAHMSPTGLPTGAAAGDGEAPQERRQFIPCTQRLPGAEVPTPAETTGGEGATVQLLAPLQAKIIR